MKAHWGLGEHTRSFPAWSLTTFGLWGNDARALTTAGANIGSSISDVNAVWWTVGIGAATLGMTAVVCRFYIKHQLNAIRGLWDDIYFRLRERCQLVGELSVHLRKLLHTNPKLVNDIEYLIKRMEETNDPHTHAAVQNGLVLTVQTAVEQFHRSSEFQADPGINKTMEAIRVVDSRLAPMRDRFNRYVTTFNLRINTPPFSFITRIWGEEERSLFPMLIPWWSTDVAAYGAITSEDIRQQLQTWRAPLILAPSQRGQWPGGAPVVQVSPEHSSQTLSIPHPEDKTRK